MGYSMGNSGSTPEEAVQAVPPASTLSLTNCHVAMEAYALALYKEISTVVTGSGAIGGGVADEVTFVEKLRSQLTAETMGRVSGMETAAFALYKEISTVVLAKVMSGEIGG